MIKPVYFPYTYVPQWVAKILASIFKHFTVYQPSGRKLPSEMQLWIEANVMEVRVPVQSKDETLAKVAKEYRLFAGLHGDSKNLKTAVFWGQRGAIPHFDESAVSRIISDVKNSSRSVSAGVDFDPLFNAQIFLDFAQEFDRQSDEINRELGVSERRSRDLYKEIKGEKENDLSATSPNAGIRPEDPAEYMALDRLHAWIRLFMADPVDSGLLMTSSPAVFNHLIENLTAAQKVMCAEGLPAMGTNDDIVVSWRDPLLKRMQQLIEGSGGTGEHTFDDVPRSQGQRSNVRLTLYLVPGEGTADILSRVLEDREVNIHRANQKAELHHTLIGLIER